MLQEHLEDLLGRFDPNLVGMMIWPSKHKSMIKEGEAPILELIDFLRTVKPAGWRLQWEGTMRHAAKDHVRDLGKDGIVSHKGTDGSTVGERLEKYGHIQGVSGQSIVYGNKTALETVMSLLIDDGVPSRPQRALFFDQRMNRFSCFRGPHKKYMYMTVCLFAEEFQTRKGP